MTSRSCPLWTLVFTASAACSPGNAVPRAEAPGPEAPRAHSPRPGSPEQELALLGREYAFNTTACNRTAEEVVDLQRTCSEKRWADCLFAGSMYQAGCGVARDLAQAEALFQRSCGFGSALGCAWEGSITKDTERGIALLERPCALGYLHACGNLGLWLGNRAHGDDFARAADLLDQACRGDELSFCDGLGILVIRLRTRARFTATLALLEHACKAGELDSCHILAIALEDGSLGNVDYARAATLLSSACDTYGHLPSCHRLGYMVWNGHGFESDPERGARYFHMACVRGYGPACDSMGGAVERSLQGAENPALALEFYDAGCKLDSEHACERARELRGGGAGSVAPAGN